MRSNNNAAYLSLLEFIPSDHNEESNFKVLNIVPQSKNITDDLTKMYGSDIIHILDNLYSKTILQNPNYTIVWAKPIYIMQQIDTNTFQCTAYIEKPKVTSINSSKKSHKK